MTGRGRLQSRPRFALAVSATLVAGLLAFGCGGGDDDESTASEPMTSGSRAELIAQADALCTESGDRINAAVQERIQMLDTSDPSNEQLTKIFADITVPELEKLYDEIGQLEPSAEDAADFQAIIDAADEAVAEVKKNPGDLVVFSGEETPFDEVNALQQDFGFQVCGGGEQDK